jgi:hypothetical protein
MIADYLKSQAARCLSLARACFDLETARQLRLMADDFRAKADETAQSTRRQSGSMQQQPLQQQQQQTTNEDHD